MRKGLVFWGIAILMVGILLLIGAFFPDAHLGRLVLPLLLIALGGWMIWGILAAPRVLEGSEISLPLEGARQAHVRIRYGAGRLRLDGSAEPGTLASGMCGSGADLQVTRDGDTANVDLRMPGAGFPHIYLPWTAWGPGGPLDWSLGLSGEIPLALDLQVGAGESRLDLTKLKVTDLEVRSDAGAMTITAPANAGHTRARIRSSVGAVKIAIPENVAGRILIHGGGMAGISVNRSRFPREGGVYQSPGYDTATNRLDLDIEASIGAVEVR